MISVRMSLTSAYFAEPAFPTLASSLLGDSFPETTKRTSRETLHDAPSRRGDQSSQEWSLKHDIEISLRSDKDSIFRCGTITGFSRLREGNADEDKARVGEVSR